MKDDTKVYNEIEIAGSSMFAFLNGTRRGQELKKAILAKHNVTLTMDSWIPFAIGVDIYTEMGVKMGDYNLFATGKAIIDNADFPPMNGLEDALHAIDIAYHMNHRLDGEIMFNPETGEKLEGIGRYELLSFDANKREATMIAENPYPSKFDEGIIYGVVEKFCPQDSTEYTVRLDPNAEQRNKGGKSCTYLIRW